jgi:hypothetical protein
MALPPNLVINASALRPGDILYPFRSKVVSVAVIASYRDPEAPAQIIARLEGDIQVPSYSPRNRLHVHRPRTRTFDLYEESPPIPSASGNGEYYSTHTIILRGYRPAPGDLSPSEVRALARVSKGGGLPLGGGAAPRYFIRRTDV